APAGLGGTLPPGRPVVHSGTNSALRPPVCGSSVALSKSITPSNKPDVRMNSLSALRLSSCSGKPCAAFEAPSALTHRGADHAHLRPLRPNAPDNLPHAVLRLLHRCVAVAAEIVDSFEPDHGGDARELEHVALDALHRRRSARERFLWAVFRRPCDLIAADARIDHRDAVAVHGMQPP